MPSGRTKTNNFGSHGGLAFGGDGDGLFFDNQVKARPRQAHAGEEASNEGIGKLQKRDFDLVAAGLALEASPTGRGRKRSMQARDEDDDGVANYVCAGSGAGISTNQMAQRRVKRHDHRQSPTNMLFSDIGGDAGAHSFDVSVQRSAHQSTRC